MKTPLDEMDPLEWYSEKFIYWNKFKKVKIFVQKFESTIEIFLFDPTKIVKSMVHAELKRGKQNHPIANMMVPKRRYAIYRTKNDDLHQRHMNTTQSLQQRLMVFAGGMETVPEVIKDDIYDELKPSQKVYKAIDEYSQYEISNYPDVDGIVDDANYF